MLTPPHPNCSRVNTGPSEQTFNRPSAVSTVHSTHVPYPQPMRCSKLSCASMPRFAAHAATAFIIGNGPHERMTGFSSPFTSSFSIRSRSVTTLPSDSSMLYVLSAYRPTYPSPKRTLRYPNTAVLVDPSDSAMACAARTSGGTPRPPATST